MGELREEGETRGGRKERKSKKDRGTKWRNKRSGREEDKQRNVSR